MKRQTQQDIFHPPSTGRFGPDEIDAAAGRHLLYLKVRDHARAGWTSLPPGLTDVNRRDIAVMAKSRSDQTVLRLFRRSTHDLDRVERAV